MSSADTTDKSGGLFTSTHVVAKAIRFTAIGVASAAIYAVITFALIAGLGVSPILGSILGYCGAIPFSFLGHRQFSFRSDGRWTIQALRFCLIHGLNIAVTGGSMAYATQTLGIAYYWGMLIASVLVPVANFLFMNLWVFREKPASARSQSRDVNHLTLSPDGEERH